MKVRDFSEKKKQEILRCIHLMDCSLGDNTWLRKIRETGIDILVYMINIDAYQRGLIEQNAINAEQVETIFTNARDVDAEYNQTFAHSKERFEDINQAMRLLCDAFRDPDFMDNYRDAVFAGKLKDQLKEKYVTVDENGKKTYNWERIDYLMNKSGPLSVIEQAVLMDVVNEMDHDDYAEFCGLCYGVTDVVMTKNIPDGIIGVRQKIVGANVTYEMTPNAVTFFDTYKKCKTLELLADASLFYRSEESLSDEEKQRLEYLKQEIVKLNIAGLLTKNPKITQHYFYTPLPSFPLGAHPESHDALRHPQIEITKEETGEHNSNEARYSLKITLSESFPLGSEDLQKSGDGADYEAVIEVRQDFLEALGEDVLKVLLSALYRDKGKEYVQATTELIIDEFILKVMDAMGIFMPVAAALINRVILLVKYVFKMHAIDEEVDENNRRLKEAEAAVHLSRLLSAYAVGGALAYTKDGAQEMTLYCNETELEICVLAYARDKGKDITAEDLLKLLDADQDADLDPTVEDYKEWYWSNMKGKVNDYRGKLNDLFKEYRVDHPEFNKRLLRDLTPAQIRELDKALKAQEAGEAYDLNLGEAV